MAISVEYQTMILNADGSIAKKNPPKKNLILDSGLNRIGVDHIVDCFEYAVVGTGTTPTNRDSSTTTFSRSGTTVTSNANFFEADDVGRLLKFDSGEEMYITTFNSVTEVVVDTSGTIASDAGTIWYVNETAHETETKRTKLYTTNSGDNSTTLLSGVITHKRTFLFSAEVGSVTYTEIGWAWATTGSLFGRDLIGGGGDSLEAGQQYKVVLNVTIDLSPKTQTAVTDVGNNGFNTAGTVVIPSTSQLADINSIGDRSGGSLDPGIMSIANLSINTADYTQPSGPSVSLVNTGPEVTNLGTDTYSTYSNGDFFRDCSVKLSVNEANSANIYGISLTSSASSSSYFNIKFTTPQEKDSDHTLELTFRMSWGRNLTN